MRIGNFYIGKVKPKRYRQLIGIQTKPGDLDPEVNLIQIGNSETCIITNETLDFVISEELAEEESNDVIHFVISRLEPGFPPVWRGIAMKRVIPNLSDVRLVYGPWKEIIEL
jgi:hypothetical protein